MVSISFYVEFLSVGIFGAREWQYISSVYRIEGGREKKLFMYVFLCILMLDLVYFFCFDKLSSFQLKFHVSVMLSVNTYLAHK